MTEFVTWTTPFQRADAALRRAGEHLEFKRLPEARRELEEHLRQMRELLRYLDENGLHPAYAPKERG